MKVCFDFLCKTKSFCRKLNIFPGFNCPAQSLQCLLTNFLSNPKSSKTFWLHCSRVAPLFPPMVHWSVPTSFTCNIMLSVSAQVLMECSGVDGIFGCCYNVRVFKQCFVVDAMFRCLCNFLVLMQWSGFNAMFWC